MGRPPKLSDRQKAEIGRRLATGESMASLAKEFKVGRATMTRVFSGRVQNIEKVAKTLAMVELEVDRMPVSEQVSVRTLADQLKSLSESAVHAGATGMKTASLLHERAWKHVKSLDEEATIEDLRLSDAMLTVAGKASALGVSLMSANKDAGKVDSKKTLESILDGTTE